MRPLPEKPPDVDRHWVLRVAPDPYLRLDTNDYSLDPGLVGRRVEIHATQHEITATVLDTGELACRHERSFAKHRTITALEHARKLRARRGDHAEPEPGSFVQQRSLTVYDQLIAREQRYLRACTPVQGDEVARGSEGAAEARRARTFRAMEL